MNNRMLHSNKGFTLIELLVVIAIIGMLAAVVLASVGSARNKGVDAALKHQLKAAQTQAEVFATVGGSNNYTNVCSTAVTAKGLGGASAGSYLDAAADAVAGTTVQGTFGAAQGATEVYCYSTATQWMMQAPAKATAYWCVDSKGNSKAEANTATLNQVSCL